MAILTIINTKEGLANKASLEAASYGSAMAKTLGVPSVAVVAGSLTGDGGLGNVGVDKVLHRSEALGDEGQLARLSAAAADECGATIVVMSHDHTGRAVAPRVAVRLGAGLVSGVTALPDGGAVPRNVFSGKAMAEVEVTTEKAVYTITPNAFGVAAGSGNAAVESFDAEVGPARVRVTAPAETGGEDMVPLPEAELVVSAGRGLKGPEHWGIVEELAQALGATTACSRPVSDIGWRPHHEHVGQTGITIRPNLYIAAGISGAIQHLAGVNQSKVIVVINTDPEAPFFKAADYGIVGDAFEVLPKLTAAAKALGH